jgi:hypothetical protein
MTVSIQIEGLEALTKKLGKLTAQGALKPAMARSLARLQNGLMKMPPPVAPGGGWVSRMTPKARAWFFANLREGKITIPYKRTGKLQQGWSIKIETGVGGPLGMRGIVGNDKNIAATGKYARFVQDEEKQAAIHKGRWPTVQGVAKAERNKIVKDFQDEIKRLMNE